MLISRPVAPVMPVERMHGAWDAGHAVAGAGVFPFGLTVPGGRVAAAGVTLVGVLPTHRRRGILHAMMRAQFDDCRERGEPVACLWVSEDAIYGRFGYGLASLAAEIDLAREWASFAAPFTPSGDARIVPREKAEDLVGPVYERVAAATPGMFARTRRAPPGRDRARDRAVPHRSGALVPRDVLRGCEDIRRRRGPPFHRRGEAGAAPRHFHNI